MLPVIHHFTFNLISHLVLNLFIRVVHSVQLFLHLPVLSEDPHHVLPPECGELCTAAGGAIEQRCMLHGWTQLDQNFCPTFSPPCSVPLRSLLKCSVLLHSVLLRSSTFFPKPNLYGSSSSLLTMVSLG